VSYQVFARKYRPQTFKDVLGQDHVVKTLRNAIEQERLAHAYLFVGPRGTGKTSTARIFAKALNCSNGPSIEFDPNESICQEIAEGRSLDVLEIDGASNNGVDQVRDLRETAQFAPSQGRFKIYYIDEVHMLSNAAFNALLKILEEPPAHVKFIFATTEAHKILPTIISRCQRFDLRPIPTETIAAQVEYISSNEGVHISKSAAWAIAKGADGGMRDAQSMLDQLVAFCGARIEEQDVLNIFGFTSRETVAKLASGVLGQNMANAMAMVEQEAEKGKDLSQILNELIGVFRALLVSKIDANAGTNGIPEVMWVPLAELSNQFKNERLLSVIEILADAEQKMRLASNKRIHFEVALIKAIQALNEIAISDVITALGGVEPAPITAQSFSSANMKVEESLVAAPVLERESSSASEKIAEEQPSSLSITESDIPVSNVDSEPIVAPEEVPNHPEGNSEVDNFSSSEPQLEESTTPIDDVNQNVIEVAIPSSSNDDDFFSQPMSSDDAFFQSEEEFSEVTPFNDSVAENVLPMTAAEPRAIEQECPATIEAPTSAFELAPDESFDLVKVKEVWGQVIQRFAETHPMQVVSMEAAVPIEVRGTEVVIGLPVEDSYARNVLCERAFNQAMHQVFAELLGAELSLLVELSDQVKAVEILIESPVSAPIAPKETSKPQAQSKLKSKEKSDDSTEDPNEDFYEDPLIKEALSVFEGKIRKS